MGGKGRVVGIRNHRRSFLRNMVRAVVGSLYEVGKGNWSVEDFIKRCEQKNRGAMGTSAPAHGLYLINVTYNNL